MKMRVLLGGLGIAYVDESDTMEISKVKDSIEIIINDELIYKSCGAMPTIKMEQTE